MKIALAPDLHCFYSTYDVATKKGESIRKKEWKLVGAKMLATCKEQGVETVIFPGDFFVNPKPTAEEVLIVASLLHAFERAGMNVIGITGNHDITGAGRKSMDEVVAEIGRNKKWCYSSFDTDVIGDVGFAFLPFVKVPELTAYNPDYASRALSEQLTHVTDELYEKLGDVKKKILIGHWSIQGAITSSGKTMENTLTGTETVIPLGDLVRRGWDACLFGHIHLPQVLKESKPFVAYSGCFQRINVGEAKDPRGFFIFDTDTDQYKFHKLPSIKIKAFKKEIHSEQDFKALIDEIKAASLKGSFAYVKYEVDKDDFDLVDKRAILKALDEAHPLNIAGVMPKVICKARQRDASLTEALDGETALSKWLDNKKVDAAKIKNVMNLYRKLTDELNETDDGEDNN